MAQRKKRRQGKRKQHGQSYIRVPLAQITVADDGGERYVRRLDLPSHPRQWTWALVRDDTPLWMIEDSGIPASDDEPDEIPFQEPASDQPNSEENDAQLDWSFVPNALRDLVKETISTGDVEAVYLLEDAFAAEGDLEAAGFGASMVVAQLMKWLVSARAVTDTRAATEAIDWVKDHLGAEAHRSCMVLAGFLGHPLAPDITVGEAYDRLDNRIVPALVWLVSGSVATTAQGDVAWLEQFDLEEH